MNPLLNSSASSTSPHPLYQPQARSGSFNNFTKIRRSSSSVIQPFLEDYAARYPQRRSLHTLFHVTYYKIQSVWNALLARGLLSNVNVIRRAMLPETVIRESRASISHLEQSGISEHVEIKVNKKRMEQLRNFRLLLDAPFKSLLTRNQSLIQENDLSFTTEAVEPPKKKERLESSFIDASSRPIKRFKAIDVDSLPLNVRALFQRNYDNSLKEVLLNSMMDSFHRELYVLRSITQCTTKVGNSAHLPRLINAYSRAFFDVRLHTTYPGLSICKAAKEKKQGFATAEIYSLLHQLLGALYNLHARGISHGDIRPDNTCLDETYRYLTLINFESADSVEIQQSFSGISDTLKPAPSIDPLHRSPESLVHEKTGLANDMWGVGCFAFELYTGKSLLMWNRRVREADDVSRFYLTQLIAMLDWPPICFLEENPNRSSLFFQVSPHNTLTSAFFDPSLKKIDALSIRSRMLESAKERKDSEEEVEPLIRFVESLLKWSIGERPTCIQAISQINASGKLDRIPINIVVKNIQYVDGDHPFLVPYELYPDAAENMPAFDSPFATPLTIDPSQSHYHLLLYPSAIDRYWIISPKQDVREITVIKRFPNPNDYLLINYCDLEDDINEDESAPS